MFFRIKKIKGKEYAYVVENEWKRKGSRQKVKSYIGRVYRFEMKNNVEFLEFLKITNLEDYINNNEKSKIINDLVEWELFKFGINKQEFSINLSNMKIQKSSRKKVSGKLKNKRFLSNNKNVALFLNDGFMCNLTLKNLLDFKSEGDESSDGYRLARAFVETGIKVPQEVFVGLCQKLFSF